MSCSHTSAPACPCGTTVFPQVICNPPGLSSVAYRIGDFTAFRSRLLQALDGEQELTVWRPGASGDLAVQMIEWWAYVADILTLYNERIANESWLGTAMLPESVNHLVQVLGYRPRPALGARAQVAAVLAVGARTPLTMPALLQVQSKPGPGASPQVFEMDQPASVTAPDIISAVVSPTDLPLLPQGGGWVWLAGKVSGIKPADRLLLIKASALTTQTIADYAWIKVTGTAAQADPLGNPMTQVSFTTVAGGISGDVQAADYVLLRSSQSSPLWSYLPAPAVVAWQSAATSTVTLAGVARVVTPGSLLLLDISDAAAKAGPTATPIIAQSYAEAVWYANGNGPAQPFTSPPVVPVGIPVAQIGFASLDSTGTSAASWQSNAGQVTVRWGWTPVGQLAPVLTQAALTYTGGNSVLVPAPGAADFPSVSVPVLLEDASGNAAAATANPATPPAGATSAITLALDATPPIPAAGLASPISVMFDLVAVSRGKTVASEVLGSGNPSVAGQDFTLSQSPVTYFADPASISGDGFSSTVSVYVNGVQWQEQQSFYGQPPNAPVFVLHEDDQAQTHVSFGDGVNGALLPTGTNNVVATYRTGAGYAAPAAETLTVVLNPLPGLKGVRNPLQATGGADADAAAKLSTLAPQSVLTFNRAVSLDDYAAIAMTAAGVTQAVAAFAFDPAAQRPMVTMWVAGDSGAVAAAQAALAGTAVPYQGLKISAATPLTMQLSLTYLRDPRYPDPAVQAGLTAALLDPDEGLFGANVVGIGEVFYDSQIAAACLAVPGVTAIHQVSFTDDAGLLVRFGFSLGRFRIIRFVPAAPSGCSGQRHDPGAGNYFVVPNDGQHLQLSGAPG